MNGGRTPHWLGLALVGVLVGCGGGQAAPDPALARLGDGPLALLREGPGPIDYAAARRLVAAKKALLVDVQLAPIVRSGLAARILDALPPAARRAYDGFLEETGFDPFEVLEGALLASSASDLAEVDTGEARVEVVLVAGRMALSGLLGYLVEKSPGARDPSGGARPVTVVVAAPLDTAERARLVDLMVRDRSLDGGRILRIGATTTLQAGRLRGGGFLAYLWDGGMVVETWPAPAEDVVGEAARRAHDLARRLRAAAEAPAAGQPPEDQAVAFHVKTRGEPIEGRLRLGERCALDVLVPTSLFGGRPAAEVVAAWEAARGDFGADAATGIVAGVPAPFRPLAAALVRTLAFEARGERLGIGMALPLPEVLRLLP